MKPTSAKAKGRGWQKDVKEAILKTFPELEQDDVRSTPIGVNGEDIQLSPAARKVLKGIQIECKRVKAIGRVYEWMDQAKEHGPYMPVVFARADHKEAIVILPMDYFLKLKRCEYEAGL